MTSRPRIVCCPASAPVAAQDLERSAGRVRPSGILPSDEPFTEWVVDPEVCSRRSAATGSKQREVHGTEQSKTVKLKNVVPPIRFESGVADIPPSYVEKLRKTVLDDMQRPAERAAAPRRPRRRPAALAVARRAVYGDNAGTLARARRRGRGVICSGRSRCRRRRSRTSGPATAQPIAPEHHRPRAARRIAASRSRSGTTSVETRTRVLQEVVVPDDIQRVKVCRTETRLQAALHAKATRAARGSRT